jgi:hypothetical protein
MRVIAKEFYVKNYAKCLGIIAIVAVIGLFAACGGEDPEKTIKVTGVPAEYRKPTIYIHLSDVSNPKHEFTVAVGDGQISGSTVTFDLYAADDSGRSSVRWTGKGTFNVHLFGIEGKFIYADDTEINKTVTTIPFSMFSFL